MIPARVRIGNTEWETSLFHKDGAYVIPIKAVVRRTENLDEGNEVVIWLEIQ